MSQRARRSRGSGGFGGPSLRAPRHYGDRGSPGGHDAVRPAADPRGGGARPVIAGDVGAGFRHQGAGAVCRARFQGLRLRRQRGLRRGARGPVWQQAEGYAPTNERNRTHHCSTAPLLLPERHPATTGRAALPDGGHGYHVGFRGNDWLSIRRICPRVPGHLTADRGGMGDTRTVTRLPVRRRLGVRSLPRRSQRRADESGVGGRGLNVRGVRTTARAHQGPVERPEAGEAVVHRDLSVLTAPRMTPANSHVRTQSGSGVTLTASTEGDA
jgi:hypothetical protein